jgi:exosortase A-associated hydrolase 1
MRRVIAFPCEGMTLLGTLDVAPDTTGLLIVSGGNEVRAGAHRGMALISARVADAGYPVLRFDRRGIGDSEGTNNGWSSSAPDVTAAIAAFRTEQPQLARLVVLGNCDAATALACNGGLGADALVLTNPWTSEDCDGLPPAAAIRQRYAERLRDPRAWWQIVTGRLSFRKLVSGLSKLARPVPQDITSRFAAGLAQFSGPITIILADGDATATGFHAHWASRRFAHLRHRAKVIKLPTASHSFQHAADTAALEAAVLDALTT